jgi:hypothetical protein
MTDSSFVDGAPKRSQVDDVRAIGRASEEACWVADLERLHCLLLVVDNVASRLSSRAGPAFIRAFILEDRTSGEMRMKFRFHYINPEDRDWYIFGTAERGQEAVEHFENGLRLVLDEAARMLGEPLPDGAIQTFYPPDDGGDAGRTLIWLEQHDLIEITSIRKEEG